MLTIPKILDRWILKNLANYPDVYHVFVEKNLWFAFEYHSDLVHKVTDSENIFNILALNFTH